MIRSSLKPFALFLAAGARLAAGDAQPLPLTADGGWELRGGAKLERLDGRDVLSVESGLAYKRDVRLQDGTIDFDVQLTRRRSFVYLMFRMQDDREFEEIYLRPHKSSLPDAVQYAPVYQGASAWQLYHGPGATAAVTFEPGAWTHVRLVLQGQKAALFVGDTKEPALVVQQLARDAAPGYLALRGFAPPGTGAGPIARYANVSVKPGVTAYDFVPAVAKTAPDQAAPAAWAAPLPAPGSVRAWAVSRAIPVPGDGPAAELPARDALSPLTTVEARPSGLVELHRHVKLLSPDKRDVAAVARVNVRAAAAGVRRLDLGFSDVATVFLNGRPLFKGDAHYSFDDPRQEGLVHYGQAALFLPLEQGDNDLAVLVSDAFGGWGLMARFPDPSGLEVTPGR